MDPTKTIDSGSKNRIKSLQFASDIVELKDRDTPVAPALCFKKNLDGTNTPSKQGNEDHRVYVLGDDVQKDMRNNFPEKDSEELRNLRYNLESPRVAPTVGEFNNTSAPLFLEYDPRIKNNFKGVIYIACAATETPQDLRNKNARNTAYDSRNDPAWHYNHGVAMFEVVRMVKLGITAAAVNSVDEFEATDNDNNLITQAWLDQQIRYLNGRDSFDGLSSRNTSRFISARQRDITNMVNGVENEDTRRKRDKSIALAAFNKTEMLRIKITNRFGQGRIA